MLVLAENQMEAACHLKRLGAVNCLQFSNLEIKDLENQLQNLIDYPEQRHKMAVLASNITDGLGVELVAKAMKKLSDKRVSDKI